MKTQKKGTAALSLSHSSFFIFLIQTKENPLGHYRASKLILLRSLVQPGMDFGRGGTWRRKIKFLLHLLEKPELAFGLEINPEGLFGVRGGFFFVH